MNPQEALQLVNQAAGLAALTRAEHIQIQQAIQILAEAIQHKERSGNNNEPDKKVEEKDEPVK